MLHVVAALLSLLLLAGLFGNGLDRADEQPTTASVCGLAEDESGQSNEAA